MKLSEDDKWYITDAANTALPALIQAFGIPDTSGPEMARYAQNLGMLAHLIGVQMFNGRENMLGDIEEVSQENNNDTPAS